MNKKEEDIINELIKECKLDREESKVELSPDQKHLLIINPYGWETMANIYTYNLENEKLKLIHEWREPLSCKDATWIDSKEIVSILGNTYGTIDVGGNIYRINTENNQKEKITEFSDKIQVSKIRSLANNTLTVEGIKFKDDNYINSEEITKTIIL